MLKNINLCVYVINAGNSIGELSWGWGEGIAVEIINLKGIIISIRFCLVGGIAS